MEVESDDKFTGTVGVAATVIIGAVVPGGEEKVFAGAAVTLDAW